MLLPRAPAHATLVGVAGLGLFLAFGVRGLPTRVAVLSGGDPWDAATWRAVTTSRIGDALWIRLAPLVLLALAAAASFAAMRHSTLFRHRQELAALVTVPVLTPAFCIRSLPPLVRAWSRAGTTAIRLLAVTGGALAALLLKAPASLTSAWYGWALIGKLRLVRLLLGLALRHRLVLMPALERGMPEAGRRLHARFASRCWLRCRSSGPPGNASRCIWWTWATVSSPDRTETPGARSIAQKQNRGNA